MTTLYRASDNGYASQGTSFAESVDTARAYLDNPGFGGRSLWAFSVEVREEQIVDLTGTSTEALATMLDVTDPGAIGVDEWLPRDSRACDALRARGYLWARVAESFPEDTVTWIYLGTMLRGDEDPEGDRIE